MNAADTRTILNKLNAPGLDLRVVAAKAGMTVQTVSWLRDPNKRGRELLKSEFKRLYDAVQSIENAPRKPGFYFGLRDGRVWCDQCWDRGFRHTEVEATSVLRQSTCANCGISG